MAIRFVALHDERPVFCLRIFGAVAVHDGSWLFIADDPRFMNLRSDPKFMDLLPPTAP